MSFRAVIPGTNDDASGIGIGDISIGRKLRRLADRGAGDGASKFEWVKGAFNISIDDFFRRLGGVSETFNASVDPLPDKVGITISGLPGPDISEPVVEIRTLICGVEFKPGAEEVILPARGLMDGDV